MFFAIITLLALTRAEIVQRMRAPIVTQSDGLVKVFANCSEEMRREYQTPVARFAADTVSSLYTGLKLKSIRFERPGIIIFIGDGKTNVTNVITKVETNEAMRIVSRLTIKNPAIVDLELLRMEIARAFFRAVKGMEIDPTYAWKILRQSIPAFRIADERAKLEAWLVGKGMDDEEGLLLLRKVLEPGVASRRDILTFASRLYLYPRTFDEKFIGGYDALSFQDAVKFAKIDPRVRILAYFKANELPIMAGGRGEALDNVAQQYQEFLMELAKGERSEEELQTMLDGTNAELNRLLEKAK